jgi:hypothetical protein
LIKHVQEATGYDEGKTYEQIGEAIEDGELPVVWGDLLESFWKSGGSGLAIQIADKHRETLSFGDKVHLIPTTRGKVNLTPMTLIECLCGGVLTLLIPAKAPGPDFESRCFGVIELRTFGICRMQRLAMKRRPSTFSLRS